MTRSSSLFLSAAALVAAAGAALAAPPIANPEIAREGTIGESRRDKLTALELKPAAIDWSLLTDWQNGAAPTAESLKDKVVVLVFWSSWQPSNQSLIARVAQIGERNKDKGVVVVAAHNDTRYESAAKVLADKNVTVLTAKDAGNKLRSALLSDGDPDVYVIDRAGQLRYADIGSDAIDSAVSSLAAETPAVAAGAPAAFAQRLKDADAKARRTVTKGTGIEAGQKPKVTFAAPSPDAYDKAFWPTKNDKDIVGQLGTDFQGQQVPFSFEGVQWLNTPEGKAPDLIGKVVIVDLWATWCVPCKKAMPLIDEMQRTFRDDLQVVGVSGFKFGGQLTGEEAEKYPQGESRPTVQQFLREHNSEYAHAYDVGSAIMKKVTVRGIPCVFVLSTDGVVRWQGNPHQPHFRDIVAQVIERDPGVQARRLAEKKAIANKGG
ncbi:MAG TPA: TlpA disulfide reductase family protein [Phycisphaerales bacterium]|nr:TlpA disulfide reductase family protein [Phycisphaerales bacterium]